MFGVHVDGLCALVPDPKEALCGVAVLGFTRVSVELVDRLFSQTDFIVVQALTASGEAELDLF